MAASANTAVMVDCPILFRHDKYGGMRAGYHRYILHAFSFLCMDHQIGKCG